MKRSKLEMHFDILEVLAKGSLKLTHIMFRSNVNCRVLKEQLDFLTKNGLVEKKTLKKERKIYAITDRGIEVLRAFSEIKQVIPLEEEENKQAPFLF